MQEELNALRESLQEANEKLRKTEIERDQYKSLYDYESKQNKHLKGVIDAMQGVLNLL